MKSITLQSRISILFTIFTLFTIGIFVGIQLSHEVKSVNQEIEYRAKSDAQAMQDSFEEILSLPLSQKDKIERLAKKMDELKKVQFVHRAYLFDTTGIVLYSTEGWLQGKKGDYSDFSILDKLRRKEFHGSETVLDESNRLLSVYLPLREGDEVSFIVRAYFPLGDIWQAAQRVYQSAIAVGILFVLINVFLGVALSRLIIGPIKVVNDAARRIAAGNLDLRVRISTNDELEALADTFNVMTVELQKMKAKAEDANPLTKLPGNVIIKEEIEKRITAGSKFTVIYCDLDNFKAFNDKYGISRGDEAIKLTGALFVEAVQIAGGPGDFVGHEGGDDFLLITTPQMVEGVTAYIISEFDKRIRALYDEEDRQRGHIISTARDGTVQQFALMTVSLAGISNEQRVISSYGEVTNIAAEVKKKAKKQMKSCFVLDVRQK
jgi:diguanylate cyclase (GGDEF)-like protein